VEQEHKTEMAISPHPHKRYEPSWLTTRKLGGHAHNRAEAAAIVLNAALKHQRLSQTTLLLSHVVDYLNATIND
jgi:hypothetical protein